MSATKIKNTEKSYLLQIEVFFNTVNHVLIGFVTIYLTWHFFRKELTTMPLHAWLCTIGFQLLMAEAVMCFYPANSWTSQLSIRFKRALHWILQLVGSVLGIAGVAIMIDHVEGEHFTSIHGIIGLAGTVIIIVSLATGLASFFSIRLKNLLKPVMTKAVHNCLGFSGFVLALVALFYGYSHLRRQIDPNLLGLFKVVTLMTIVLCFVGPLKSLFRQIGAIISG